MRKTKIIDGHIHIDRFAEPPGPDFDFFNPPKVNIVIDEILELMDKEGVEKAVIMQHPNGPLNKEVIEVVAAYPNRLRGSMVLKYEDESCLDEMEEYYKKGLTVIKCEIFGTTMIYPEFKLDSPLKEKVYTKADELGIVMTIDPFRIGMPGYQIDELERMIPKYPNLKFVICHFGFPFGNMHKEPENVEVYGRMLDLARYDNVWFDVTAMPDMFEGIEVYPYPQAVKLVKEFISKYGAHKAIFGTDVPGELNQASYDQLIDMYYESDELTDEEKELLLYKNADKVYFGQ